MLLNKISTKYIIENIFNYINIPHFKLKLFSYSKFFQKKFNLNLEDYINVYFDIRRKYKEYLCCFNEIGDYYGKYDPFLYSNYEKDILIKSLESDLKLIYKMDIQSFTPEIINYCKNSYSRNKTIILLDIFSPFFDCLSQLQNFDEIFTIPIEINRPIKIKDDCNIINDYISAFDKLNKSNIKYSISISFCDLGLEFYYNSYKEEIYKEYWQKFIINIQNASRLLLFNYINYVTDVDGDYWKPNIGTNMAFARLSLFDYLKFNNLKYLKIEDTFIPKDEPNPEKLIKFPDYLEECDLVEFRFKSNINENGNFECNNVVYCIFDPYRGYNPDKNLMDLEYSKIFDFSKIKKIKILTIEAFDFIHLNNGILLEKVTIYSSREIEKEIEKKMIEKLISIKTLKDITFSLKIIEDNEILQIKDENNSVTNLKLYIFKKDCEIYNLQKKFPNLINLSISNLYKTGNFRNNNICQFCKEWFGNSKIDNDEDENSLNIKNILGSKNKTKGIMIKDEQKCNINKLNLNIGDNSNVKLFISFEKLIEIKLIGLINLNILPIFNKNCNIIFNSLAHFECKVGSEDYLFCYERFYKYGNELNNNYYNHYGDFSSYYYNKEMKDFLNNIYNNINCMPNLKVFIYEFPSSIEENIYLKLIKTLLEKKLNTIVLRLYSNKNKSLFREYTFNELKAFYPDINRCIANNYNIGEYKSLNKK